MKTIAQKLLILCLLLSAATAGAQELPKDFLKPEFHKNRREALRDLMPKNSVAVFFANPVRNRANDVDFIYHQDPDFYYLTGYKEPHAVLLIFSETQIDPEGEAFDEQIFVQKRDPSAEMWNGRRLGTEGVQETLGFSDVFNGEDFTIKAPDFQSFDKILFYNFKNDVRDGRDKADLFSLIETFKEKAEVPADLDDTKSRAYALLKATDMENTANVAQVLDRIERYMPAMKEDEVMKKLRAAELPEARIKIMKNISELRHDTQTLDNLTAQLRQVKLPEEMVLLKKAVRISAMGQREVMKAMHPKMSETEIQGIHEFVYKKYDSEYEGYPSIVGGGHNGCILHYIENNKPKVGNDLVLMDLGAEYHGYTADVTRTIPANGKFSPEQKAIYDLVYEAQEAGIAVCKKGAPFRASHEAAAAVINEGLAKLGIIESADASHRYFPHGTSHHIGLDVHDKGTYGPLEENMVITVEPGIYIPENSACDKKWWGIAVRIEDDILITAGKPVNLSDEAPRKSDEIEKLMAEESPLKNFVLPVLEDK